MNGYTCGPYGDGRTKNHRYQYRDGEYLNEWELIPEEQKEILVTWINNNLTLDQLLYDQSLILQASNPITKYLVKEKIFPPIETEISEDLLESLPESQLEKREEKPVLHHHAEAAPFMEKFMQWRDDAKISLIYQPDRFRIGFVVNDLEEIHFIHFATLAPIWRPKSQKELFEETIKAKKAQPQKSDEHLYKIFVTTSQHGLGQHWGGILELNIPELSTIIGGIQHALQIPSPRYKIKWVNLKNPHDKTIMLYESPEISSMIEKVEIIETKGDEKAPSVYPKTLQVPYYKSAE